MTIVLLLILLASLLGFYWQSRYGGLEMEGDAANLSLAGEGVAQEAVLVPSHKAYPNGFGLPALMAFLNRITSMSIPTIQSGSYIWAAVIALVAYLAYRELLIDIPVAGMAVLFLLIQPDFLFYILRGSHEKITWTFGLLILWLWVRSRKNRRLSLQIASVLSVYILLWGMITNNAYFASTLIALFCIAILASYPIMWLLSRKDKETIRSGETRMVYILLLGFMLVYIFITYTYPPALSFYGTLGILGDKVTTLFLAGETQSQPYTYVQTAWRSSAIYLALTGFQWLIVAASFLAWLRDALRLRKTGREGLSQPRFLLWLFYLGIIIQLAFAVVMDFAGFLSSNTQVRLFTPFAILSSPYAATWLNQISSRRLKNIRILLPASFVAGCAVIFALLKSTNDPLVGNQWIFYNQREQQANDWMDSHLKDQSVWLDLSIHQLDVLYFRKGYNWIPSNTYLSGSTFYRATYSVISDLTILQANRSELKLPNTTDQFRIYDNGGARIFHVRPKTSFQH